MREVSQAQIHFLFVKQVRAVSQTETVRADSLSLCETGESSKPDSDSLSPCETGESSKPDSDSISLGETGESSKPDSDSLSLCETGESSNARLRFTFSL